MKCKNVLSIGMVFLLTGISALISSMNLRSNGSVKNERGLVTSIVSTVFLISVFITVIIVIFDLLKQISLRDEDLYGNQYHIEMNISKNGILEKH